jgi:hypothetical protein
MSEIVEASEIHWLTKGGNYKLDEFLQSIWLTVLQILHH